MWQRNKKYTTLIVGIILMIVAFKTITYRMDSHISNLKNNGVEATATVGSMFDTKIRTKGRYGIKSEWVHYKMFVEFYDSNYMKSQMEGLFDGELFGPEDVGGYGADRFDKIEMYVTEEEYEALHEGSNVDVVFIEGFNNGSEMPEVLLKSTVESSIFKRFSISITGHFNTTGFMVVGVILLLGSILTTLIGFILVRQARSK